MEGYDVREKLQKANIQHVVILVVFMDVYVVADPEHSYEIKPVFKIRHILHPNLYLESPVITPGMEYCGLISYRKINTRFAIKIKIVAKEKLSLQ